MQLQVLHRIMVFVTPACGKARLSCYYFAKIYVHASSFVRGHNSYIYAWISKLFDTVVVLEEEKCHLKHFFLGRLKVKVTLEGHIN